MQSVTPKIGRNFVMKGASTTFPENIGLGEYLFRRLKEHGTEILMIDAATGRELTASRLLQDAVTLADALRKFGLGPGASVSFCSENRLEYPVATLATLFIGATCAPVNALYTIQELMHLMSISRPNVVFCSINSVEKMIEVKKQAPFLHKIIVFDDVAADPLLLSYKQLIQNPSNTAIFQCAKVDSRQSVAGALGSSGTTGLPKCVELTDFNYLMMISTFMDERFMGDLASETALGIMPFFHAYGFGISLVCIASKMKLIVMSGFREKPFLEAIQNYKITTLYGVPPLLIFLSKNSMVLEYDLSSLKKILCGAAPLSKEVQLATKKRFKMCEIKQGYGMTELTIGSVFSPVGLNKMGASGVVCPGMECRVIDVSTGKNLPPYKEGELCFKGPLVMKGYKNNKKATDETIDNDGWLHSGDIAYYDREGFIFIVDRLKELIKYKGFQVAPAELEAILLTHPSIKDAAVIGIPDEKAGEKPYGFVVKQPGANPTASEIQKFVAEKVSPQKRLSGGLRFVEEIPKNPSGKILRRELRNIFKMTSKL